MYLYGLVGAGGFGREVMPIAQKMLERMNTKNFKLVFIDDGVTEKKINGYEVLNTEEFFALEADQFFFNITIGSGKIRERIATSMFERGASSFSIRDANSVVLDENDIDNGAVLCPFTTVTSNTKIGKFFQSNLYSYVAHDCIIGDFVTFAPGVKCNGNVHIENHVYIGTGAIIKQGSPDRPLIIGEGAVIGMGAVVNKNIPAGAVVVGNPAKPLRPISGDSK